MTSPVEPSLPELDDPKGVRNGEENSKISFPEPLSRREITGKREGEALIYGRMAERKSPKASSRKGRPRSPAGNFEYPDQTRGSRLAAQLREETNALNVSQRSELFQRGMQMIYGGAEAKEKSGPGH